MQQVTDFFDDEFEQPSEDEIARFRDHFAALHDDPGSNISRDEQ